MLDKETVYRTHNHSRREEAAQNDDLDGVIEGQPPEQPIGDRPDALSRDLPWSVTLHHTSLAGPIPSPPVPVQHHWELTLRDERERSPSNSHIQSIRSGLVASLSALSPVLRLAHLAVLNEALAACRGCSDPACRVSISNSPALV
jgi:hypothetical protein